MKANISKHCLLGALAVGMTLGVAATPSLAQSKIYVVADCSVPHSASQRQECAIERSRQQEYASDGQLDTVGPSVLPDNRPVMSLDNGGGGTQSPVVPNTTGAPVTTGAPFKF